MAAVGGGASSCRVGGGPVACGLSLCTGDWRLLMEHSGAADGSRAGREHPRPFINMPLGASNTSIHLSLLHLLLFAAYLQRSLRPPRTLSEGRLGCVTASNASCPQTLTQFQGPVFLPSSPDRAASHLDLRSLGGRPFVTSRALKAPALARLFPHFLHSCST